MPLVTRLAPSPTGLLHIGHARSFLLAWWSVRSRGGAVVLRLDDLDTSRVRPEFIEACLEDLSWLGLDWDGEAQMQSERSLELRQVATDLEERGLAYPCVCTRSEIRAAVSAPHPEEGAARYPGTCKGLFTSMDHARSEGGREPALRFITPNQSVEIEDAIHGKVELSPHDELGDFPITSRDGQVAYHLAVVVDDARQGVTEVIRGDDLLRSCGPQALLCAALDIERPDWVHVPLVFDAAGVRLAKRADGLSIKAMRDAGVNSTQLVRWIAHTSGLPDSGPVSPVEVLDRFDINLLPSDPVRLPGNLIDSLARGQLPAGPPA